MKLSIITINYNNAIGLRNTIQSVIHQTFKEFEYIIIDGGSIDNSLQEINVAFHMIYDNAPQSRGDVLQNGLHVQWISEPDSGIYNAMNEGIRMAKGEYIQFLNSGDIMASNDVTEKMLGSLPNDCNILYGNMLKPLSKRIHRDRGFAGKTPTMVDFYTGTLNHSSAYIKRTLFDTYGLYDENLKIVSDWKWYLQVIALNDVKPNYVDIDVTIFDMTGISTMNSSLDKEERMQVLSEILPLSVLKDYESYSFPIEQVKRINRYWITSAGFRLVERLLFKFEKKNVKNKSL
jgi:glycosyltransferase involved in cell wall biosynthesis